ncbi:Os08g0528750 [Oryza sativa Japonica Group]|uniref:Os08g0528750 protein n=1 Tax=Oryza sativa subsp. japonica TaxID=39947 RepID=A0A0P0XIK6_ORYSJ|nr:Os08g0528750 [Oryza sativa Japonica Group]
MLGLITFSRLELTIALFLFKIEHLEGSQEGDPELEPRGHVACVEALGAAGQEEEAGDLGVGQADAVAEGGDAEGDAGRLGAEEPWLGGEDRGEVRAGEADPGEDGEHRVRLGGGLEVGDVLGGFERLGGGEAAGVDEVVLHGEGCRGRGCGGGGWD